MLGAFRLVEHVAQGSAGHVFRAVHVASGASAAVKVHIETRGHGDAVRASFHEEVMAMARLDHPHVAAILDCGIVPQRAADSVPTALFAGVPYLVMEWASGGTLQHVTFDR